MLVGGRKARRIRSPGTSSRYATAQLCGSLLHAAPMQDTWPGLHSLSPSFLPLTKASIWDRLQPLCNWPPGNWASAHASPQWGSQRKPKQYWVFPKISTLTLRSPLVILSPAPDSLTRQNQMDANRSMKWFSGNGGMDE